MIRRPLVRYHGGKWRIAPWIISHFPSHRVYVEPFGGGGSVLLRKLRSYAEIYNDMDGEIVNLFRVARDHGEELARRIALTPFAREEFNASYLPAEDPIEQARRTVVRSFLAFSSSSHARKTGFRSNSNRRGTTPASDWRNFPTALQGIIERLSGVVIECRDACDVMMAHDGPSTLHYVDPPYVSVTRDKGSDYRHEMTDEDHRRLAECLHGLQGTVILSGYPSVLYDELYSDWRRVEKAAYADGAAKRTECLWMKGVSPSDLFQTAREGGE